MAQTFRSPTAQEFGCFGIFLLGSFCCFVMNRHCKTDSGNHQGFKIMFSSPKFSLPWSLCARGAPKLYGVQVKRTIGNPKILKLFPHGLSISFCFLRIPGLRISHTKRSIFQLQYRTDVLNLGFLKVQLMMLKAKETFQISEFLTTKTQLHLHTPFQVITISTGGKNHQETYPGAGRKPAAPQVSQRKGKEVSPMIKLENVQIQQAGKPNLSHNCTILPNFPFHGKTGKRININPTSSLQAYPLSQVRAGMSRLGNSLLKERHQCYCKSPFPLHPLCHKGRWQVGCGISVSLDVTHGKSTSLAQHLSLHL